MNNRRILGFMDQVPWRWFVLNINNYVRGFLEFIGKVVWGLFVLNISALMFLVLSMTISIRINNERIVLIISSIVLLPFITGATLTGFNLISKKVRKINFDFR